MRVIAHVLCKIDDHRLVMEQMDASEAVTDIVHAYDQIANKSLDHPDPDRHMCLVGEATYGSDFKQWISGLTPSEKWRLLDRYLAHFPGFASGDAKNERDAADTPRPGRETEEQKDKRQRKHWFLMLGMILMFFVMILLVAVGVGIMSAKHMLPDNTVMKAILETATELAKILFTFK